MHERVREQRRSERREFRPLHVRLNGWTLFVLAVGAGIAVVAFFFWRAQDQAAADARLCRKIDRSSVALITFVAALPVPPRPAEQRQRDDFLTAMRAALCDPSNLPTTTH